MEFPEAEDALKYILEQDQMEKAYQLWLHSASEETFGDFWAARKKAQEPVQTAEEIYAETDALFAGREMCENI